MDRRHFIGMGALIGGVAALAPELVSRTSLVAHAAEPGPYGPLLDPDPRGIMLPVGFTSRVIAETGKTLPGSSYPWHVSPDGGATFPCLDGGWIYVSNSEVGAGGGGVGALRFGASGRVLRAYSICSGTNRNCAGGPTPWGTWLTCEEIPTGLVWECDPRGIGPAVVHPAMGAFNHEAAVCDPTGRRVYLTEDARTGKLRRFTPDRWGDLSAGRLEEAVVSGDTVTWQSSGGTAFNGGEGAWYGRGKVWFTTKGDNRVWELDVRAKPNRIRVIYDDDTSSDPVLTGVDNIVRSQSGDLLVAEDGGNMELVLIEPSGAVSPFLRIVGQDGSELTGPAFSPKGGRLYFSSQDLDGTGLGITYEVRGPFRR